MTDQTPTTDDPKPKKLEVPIKWVAMTIGSNVEINGVPCVCSHINKGRRRVTFTPASKYPMPALPETDPIVRARVSTKQTKKQRRDAAGKAKAETKGSAK